MDTILETNGNIIMLEPIQVAENEAGTEIVRKFITDSLNGEKRFILLFNVSIGISLLVNAVLPRPLSSGDLSFHFLSVL